ncbi:MAG: methyltransferase domain-containing protein [Burkholderiales bacterium]
MDDTLTDDHCRLCGAETSTVFSKIIMHSHDVRYLECRSCGSLQTVTPYWLDEAYKDARRFTDTHGVLRALRNQVLTYYVSRVLGIGPDETLVDYGGGDGLTTRALRDVGLDAFSCDRYARNLYAVGFDGHLRTGLGMVTSFEVWEHFSRPATELSELFACKPKALFVSTGIYLAQGEKWPYLGCYSGRHVFFYSPGAMDWIARTFGYDHLIAGNYVLFSRVPLNALQRKAIGILLAPRCFRFFHAWLALRFPTGRASGDCAKMRRLVNDDG